MCSDMYSDSISGVRVNVNFEYDVFWNECEKQREHHESLEREVETAIRRILRDYPYRDQSICVDKTVYPPKKGVSHD